MKILEGLPPGGIEESSVEENLRISQIICTVEVSTQENNWVYVEELLPNYSRFRSKFEREVKKFNTQSGENRSFKFSNVKGSQLWRIWRLT